MTKLNLDDVSSNSMFAAAVVTLALKAKEAGGSRVTVKDTVVRQLYFDMMKDLKEFRDLDPVAHRTFVTTMHNPSSEDVLRTSQRTLDRLSEVLSDRQKLVVCVDCITTYGWQPHKLKVELDSRDMAAVLRAFEHNMDSSTVEMIQKSFKKQTARLMTSSVSAHMKVGILVVGIGVSALSAGAAAPAMGAFIGTTFMGLSGAAAASAGLAVLGGGSLASGGLGMAGGVLLIHASSGAAYKGGTYLATTIARGSRSAFVSQLAQLHVSTMLSGYSKSEFSEIMARLDSVAEQLNEEISTLAARRSSSERRKELGRLRACVRALKAEHGKLGQALTAPGWLGFVPWGDGAKLAKLLIS